MAQTERSFVDLMVLLADNTTKGVSPQDLRDAIVSCLGGYASMYVVGSAISQAFTATPTKVTCWAGIGTERGAAADVSNDRIVIGAVGDYLITLTACVTSAPPTDLDLAFYKNGVALTGASTRVQVAAAERTSAMALGVASLVIGDYIELYAAATPDSAIVFRDAHFTLKRLG